MANSLLNSTKVTRECLRVLHQKLNFIGKVNRQYDSSFAVDGAKIGDSLKIRLPNEYVVTDGRVLTAQDTSESSVTLQVSTQKHVGMNFSSSELALNIDDFSERIIEPAMSVLAAKVESDAMSMFLDVNNAIDNIGSAITLRKIWEARKRLNDNLTPQDSNRHVLLNTQDAVDFMDSTKGLFNPGDPIAKQYSEGKIGRMGGFDFAENTLIPNHTTGTFLSATTQTVSGANQTGSSITVSNVAKTYEAGDIVTFAGCNRCHPETKEDTGELMQFVVTEDEASGGTTLAISPAIVTSGGRQNVYASPTNAGAVTKVGGASAIYKPSVAFHRDAFAFATADLVMPKGVDFAAREVMDGISLRIVRQYDINNDQLPCRVDILYGKKTLRQQLACRILSN
jgi:hypothetical protein